MSGQIAARLQELGIELAEAPKPVAAYVPFVVTGGLIFVSGQVSAVASGVRYTGKVGFDLTVEQGHQAARVCGLNILAQLSAALDGDLDRITRIVKLTGFVNCTDGFTQQPQVVNGASELMVDVFGDAGRHARAALGANALPLGMAVEVDAVAAFT
ncbi:RidA family protein [Emcibacter sp. SYSU 3D8]|uniref:RidA family protein n=1 Tax=Emcibacter sp. SYSU 3D8 TaxID=3133969 RepID=UPI0031FE7970